MTPPATPRADVLAESRRSPAPQRVDRVKEIQAPLLLLAGLQAQFRGGERAGAAHRYLRAAPATTP